MAALLIFTSDPEAARPSNSKITTTLGLVVHAAGREPFSFLLHSGRLSVYITGTIHMNHSWAGLQRRGYLMKSPHHKHKPWYTYYQVCNLKVVFLFFNS